MLDNATKLAVSAVEVLKDVLVHQRHRWGCLLGHRRQYEAWWKAEFALTLESWTWRWDHSKAYALLPEAKPRDAGLCDSPESVDLLIAPWVSGKVAIKETPRIWIEIKERGTWWQGNVNKALGTGNAGLAADLHKWRAKWTPEDIVLACQVTVHDGTRDLHLPNNWEDALDAIPGRFGDPRIVGFPLCSVSWQAGGDSPTCSAPGSERVRWARLDVYNIHPRP